MKIFTFRLVIALITLLASTVHLRAQERKVDFYEEGSRAHTFYVEAGGPGFLSLNYDTRFNKTRNGWGARSGIGYFKIEDKSVFTIPVQINYLIGKNGNYFEIGGGASYVLKTYDIYFYGSYNGYHQSDYITQKDSHIMGTLLFGYRRQPVDGGFNFRAGLSPIIYDGDFIPYLPHISFGYSF